MGDKANFVFDVSARILSSTYRNSSRVSDLERVHAFKLGAGIVLSFNRGCLSACWQAAENITACQHMLLASDHRHDQMLGRAKTLPQGNRHKADVSLIDMLHGYMHLGKHTVSTSFTIRYAHGIP